MIEQWLSDVQYKDHQFKVNQDGDRQYLQLEWHGLDSVTHEPMVVKGRKWFLSPFMTKGEVVQTALVAVLAAEEHEAREEFRYKGKAIFGPHFDIERLVAIADAVEVRS